MTRVTFIDQLPASVRIGAHDYAITVCRMADNFGTFSGVDGEIKINDLHPSKSMIVDTLLHEIGHAIIWTYNVNLADEESIVSGITPGWTQVYRDNPWLMDWIKRGLK